MTTNLSQSAASATSSYKPKIARKRNGRAKVVPASISKLKKRLDAVFSTYIRTKYSVDGICRCCTCNREFPIKKIQNGHFISRNYLATRWDERNCRPQCAGCNIWGRGKPLEFEDYLITEYGAEVIQAMKNDRKILTHLTTNDYLTGISLFEGKLKALAG